MMMMMMMKCKNENKTVIRQTKTKIKLTDCSRCEILLLLLPIIYNSLLHDELINPSFIHSFIQ